MSRDEKLPREHHAPTADAAETRAPPPVNDRREIFGWMIYDWANSAFYTTVVGALLGPYLIALAQAKRAVNQTLDVMGQYAAVQSVFDIHTTGHGNALSVCGWPALVGLDDMRAAGKNGPAST